MDNSNPAYCDEFSIMGYISKNTTIFIVEIGKNK